MVEGALAERYACRFAASAAEAGKVLSEDNIDVLLCDLRPGEESVIALARETAEADLDTAVVLIAQEDDPVAAERAFGFGAFGYVVGPRPGQLLITTMNAIRRRDLEIAHTKLGRNREDRSQTIIDMAPMPIYAKDGSGRYVVSNAKADELAGILRGDLLGQTDEAIMPPDAARKAARDDRRVLETGSVHTEEEAVTVGGVRRTFKTIKFPLLDEKGSADAVGGISVDISGDLEAMRLRDELASAQRNAIEELQLSRKETIDGLSKAINLHDPSTGRHTERIGSVASFLASKLGVGDDRIQLLRDAAPMHDVGKIGVPTEVLSKPGPLSEEEQTLMERHTLIGHKIFSQFESELSRLAGTIALAHHERFDGSGYPQGLEGEEIPFEVRIIAVADVFDALLSDRSYRPAMSVEDAAAVMAEGRGTQFDPRVLDVLLSNIDEVLSVRADEEQAGRRRSVAV
jgi:PAS domain S-box-containing protein